MPETVKPKRQLLHVGAVPRTATPYPPKDTDCDNQIYMDVEIRGRKVFDYIPEGCEVIEPIP